MSLPVLTTTKPASTLGTGCAPAPAKRFATMNDSKSAVLLARVLATAGANRVGVSAFQSSI
jgi:hypothetical protein